MPRNSPSVLIVRLDAIGDAMTLVPLIGALRDQGFRLGAVLRPANAEIFSAAALDRRHILDGSLRTFASEIEARRYDIALIATEKPAGYRIAAMAKVPARIGFENGWGKPLKTLWIRRQTTRTVFRTAGLDPNAPHECEVVLSLARSILPQAAQPSQNPKFLRPLVLDRDPQPDPRVAFQITNKWERLGASFEDVLTLARSIDGFGNGIRWIAANVEADYAQQVARALAIDVEYFSSLRPWKEAIADAAALVAPDSGAVHIAGMVGTPVVACFEKAHFMLQTARWSPWAAPYELVKIEPGWPRFAADALAELLSGTLHSSYKG